MDPLMVEHLEFTQAILYMQDKSSDKRNIIIGVQVREAEEVRGGATDWAKHFAKQFHNKLALLRSTKKTRLGSHIRIILLSLEWMQAQVASVAKEVDAPPGFPTMIVAKYKARPKVKTPPMASGYPKGTIGASAEGKGRPTAKPKTIAKPSPKPKPTQPEEVIPMTTTNQPEVDTTTPTQVEELQEQIPPNNKAVISPPTEQPSDTVNQEASPPPTKKRKRRKDTAPTTPSISTPGAD
ncbi:unnamed protein product [Calypogeia fissa]